MASTDWFRQREWTARAASEFFERLKRSRNKPQHLKIQAYTLQKAGHPEATIELADYFFEHHPDRMWASTMHLCKALALAALGHDDLAIEEFRLAVQAERDFPNVRTDGWLDFGEHVVRRHLQQLYGEILELLAEFQQHHSLVFPVQRFRFYAVQALIHEALGNEPRARQLATDALEAAAAFTSGIARHPSLGLVTGHRSELLDRVSRLAAS